MFITLLTNLIPNSFLHDEDDKQSIIFTAESITPLTANAVKCNIKQMIKCISKQLEYFHNNNLAFYGFDKDDIIVINDTLFLIVNNKYCKTLDKERKITFYGPFSKPYFSSPELTNLKCLPALIDYQTSYYSLGAIIVYYLFDIILSFKNQTEPIVPIGLKRESLEDKVFESILNTKLYWFLKRCLNDNPKKRILLFL
jgi:serine/threonine protein kinase